MRTASALLLLMAPFIALAADEAPPWDVNAPRGEVRHARFATDGKRPLTTPSP